MKMPLSYYRNLTKEKTSQ